MSLAHRAEPPITLWHTPWLMEQLCGMAMRGGCCRVDWHVSAFNPRGIAFYRRIGASVSEKARLVRLDEAAIRQLAQSVA